MKTIMPNKNMHLYNTLDCIVYEGTIYAPDDFSNDILTEITEEEYQELLELLQITTAEEQLQKIKEVLESET